MWEKEIRLKAAKKGQIYFPFVPQRIKSVPFIV